MAKSKSVPAQDHTGESLFSPLANPAVASDGEPARQYDNAGKGLSKVTPNSPGWTADAPLTSKSTPIVSAKTKALGSRPQD